MFSGRVMDGLGGANVDVTNGEYEDEPFGFVPFPGTLNLEVKPGVVADLGEPDWVKQLHDDELWFWFASLVDGERVVIVWPARGPLEDARVVELFAENGLRDVYGFGNGDTVTVLR